VCFWEVVLVAKRLLSSSIAVLTNLTEKELAKKWFGQLTRLNPAAERGSVGANATPAKASAKLDDPPRNLHCLASLGWVYWPDDL